MGKTFHQKFCFLLFLLKTKIKDLVLTSQVAASPISLSSKVFLPEAKHLLRYWSEFVVLLKKADKILV